MYIRDTQDFKPGDPATHVKYKTTEKLGSTKVLIILTPDGELVPYSAKDHNDATQANGIREGFAICSMSYSTYCGKTLNQRNLQKASGDPTKEEIISFFSLSELDAYVAEGFDPSKGDANTKWGSKEVHTKKTEILVLKNKFYGCGYELYKPKQHGANENVFKPITVNTYRVAQHRAKKRWLCGSDIDISSLVPQIPTKREIDIIYSTETDAYVAAGFDPNKGDDNEKYNTPKYYRGDQILVLEKKLYGSAYEPYIPSQHGTNQKDFKSITVDCFLKARSRARVAYEEWQNNNPNSSLSTTSATNNTSTTTTITTATSTPNATSPSVSNQVGPKRFNPIILFRDSNQVSETKEQGADNSVAASQTGSTSQQRKRTAEDSVLNATPSLASSSFALFQTNVPAVPKDPTQPKRFRPWE